jgi:hypothetical protein
MDVLRSGAPTVRAMEISEALEPDRRGIYAGCIGYFAANGAMDTCIGLGIEARMANRPKDRTVLSVKEVGWLFGET